MLAIGSVASSRFRETFRHLVDFLPHHPIFVWLGFSHAFLLPLQVKYPHLLRWPIHSHPDFSLKLDMDVERFYRVIKRSAKLLSMLILSQTFPLFPCWFQHIAVTFITTRQELIVIQIEHWHLRARWEIGIRVEGIASFLLVFGQIINNEFSKGRVHWHQSRAFETRSQHIL